MNTPIYNKLRELESEKRIPFHMPGHKRTDFEAFFGVEKMDITEITDYDNLHEPGGIIRESMDLVKDIFKSKESWYLVGGSTLGILISISSVCRQGDKILIGRNCHKAVYNCIRLLQLEAVYCYADVSLKYDICEDMKPENVEKKLKENLDIKAVVLTSPTYEGVVSDIVGIKEVIRPYGIPLIVDEAHGAHLIFHDYFPESATQAGADLVIQSTHKTLPSFTQTAVLHLCSDIVTKEQVEEMIDIYETSSPSYLLMASAEYGIMYMKENQDKLAQYVDNLKNFRAKCGQLKKIELLSQDKLSCYAYDNGKLVFSVKNAGINGKELFRLLYEKYHIELEMENLTYGIAMTSICDEKEHFDQLWEAISEIDKMCKRRLKLNSVQNEDNIEEEFYNKAKSPTNCNVHLAESIFQTRSSNKRKTRQKKESQNVVINKMQIEKEQVVHPPKILESWQCRGKEMETVELSQAIGRVSGKSVMIYPPGIPILVPGEKILKETVENISQYLYNGYNVLGLSKEQIIVLKDLQVVYQNVLR